MRCKQCDKDFVSPFCPNCGARLTENEFMGQSVQTLMFEQDDAQHDYRNADSIFRETIERHKQEIDGPRKSVEKCREACRKIAEATQWARDNGIADPNARR